MFVFRVSFDGGRAARLSNLYTYDANDVCVVMLVGLGAVLLLSQVTRGYQKGIALIILLGIGATIARSGSRGGFLGLVAFFGAALLLINSVSVARRVGFMVVLLLGLLVFAPPGYWDQMATITSVEDDYNFSSKDGRKALAERGVRYMWEYPIFGVGINNFGRAECTISGEPTGAGGIRCGAPHNSYVQAGAELGITGLLVWVSTVLGGIWALLRLRKRLPQSWRRGPPVERFLYSATHYFALGMIGFAVSAFFVSFAWTDILYIQLAMITGLYISIEAYRRTALTGVGAGASPVPPPRTAGWRVRESALRHLTAQRRHAGRTEA
jgi:O-antigen ligase